MAPTKTLVIVESPHKATMIAGYLGPKYVVRASQGHVRDLPTSASQVPAKYKGQPWARTGVDVEHDFKPIYVVSPDKRSTISELKSLLKDSDELLLATDGDREGEAIAWHLLDVLKPKVPVKRMVFNEITEKAITDAVAHTRELDTDLVDAQETRRILDRLYGYEVSPVLWKKVMPRLSAGRVQSVATRLVVDRERERIAFTSANYWDLDATLVTDSREEFSARLATLDGVRIAQGRDFDADGRLVGKGRGEVRRLDEPSAAALATALESSPFTVTRVEAKPYTRRPYAPFRTTTLQQEAGRKLGFTSQRTMSVAQELYEGGYITYMRTDSVALSQEAIGAARSQAIELYGRDHVPDKPRVYASKVKNAQEAHEAIRPAGDHFRVPAQTGLTGDRFRLYELVWMRTIASQMADAKGETLSVGIDAVPAAPVAIPGGDVTRAGFTASGRTITFHGFLRAYVESVDEGSSDDAQSRLPQLHRDQALDCSEVLASGHDTRPPARYTEPSLVAKLEELEIGRPSTYASIIRTITSRDYVFKKGQALVPTWLAFAVTRLLEGHFSNLVDYQFTADMEETLDQIAQGNAKRVEVLSNFYYGDGPAGSDSSAEAGVSGDSGSSAPADGHEGLHRLVSELGDIDARAVSTFPVGAEDSGIVVRVGRYGTYVEDAEGTRANVDDELPPDELTVAKARELLASPNGEERELGLDPHTHTMIVARNGRFGPYVTEVLEEPATDAPATVSGKGKGRLKAKKVKPRTASLFRSMDLSTVTLEDALKLLSLPRVVGADAEGTEITAQNGRYGPYLKKGTDSRSLTSEDQIFSITLEQAEQIYSQPKQRGRAAAKPPLKELGEDPTSGKPIVVKDGRFGPYVTDGETNATLRKDDSVEEITAERAQELIAEKRAKGPSTRRRTTRKTTRKTTAKKSTTRKTAAKSTATSSTATSSAKKAAPKKAAPKKATPKKATGKPASASGASA
ncbi:type I DNA topoisomerase [Acidipropionibacterium jensenii]|uniref:type I DNA topoisomerase n=1 Tax=Acidipropionibacterium jensenii TaxID=1749 RepID=UPI00264A3109|nr:type I DNA topoisomerase [Acidipropionibacterium jensenii]MDN5995630.1 type I DNA topoisomerase [Acidipropionibacterium jensenii]